MKLPTLTVRVRQLNGISLLAPFFIGERMREVYEHVKLYRTDGGGGDFVLCSTYPRVVYDPNGDMMEVAVGQLFEGTEKVNLIIKKPTKENRVTEDTVSSNYNGFFVQAKARPDLSKLLLPPLQPRLKPGKLGSENLRCSNGSASWGGS